jgi:hypothetical protein
MTARVEGASAEMVDWKADSSVISCMVAIVSIVYVGIWRAVGCVRWMWMWRLAGVLE